MRRTGGPRFDEALLESYSNLPGVSGGEDAVRRAVIESVREHVDTLEVDAMGSVVATIAPQGVAARGRNGSVSGQSKRRGPHVMLCAHLDEVGLMVTAFEKDGRVRVRRVGGIDGRILVSQVFRIGAEGIPGVIGILPPHLVPRAERDKVVVAEDLYLDIGASTREEAERHVAVGDYAVFDTVYERWGSTRKGKAFDDRVGCAVLSSLVRQRPPVPVTAVWSVQEEVGLRGAAAAARRVGPDLAIVLEGTASGEIPGAKPEEAAPRMGGGPALTVQDRSLMADARLVDLLERTAKKHRIPTQWKRPGIGGTDAGRIAISGTGVPAAVVSVACRYIHAPAAYLDIRDPERVVSLVWNTLQELRKEWP
ncbi:MAG TPA: M20/M25/M40 family metallo-hydrolase [Candidatus Eisenbacteria bacterium]|nr:M20/M25/M40 family metallo-hydrolase [Candidatus Eisenbacteria bacterium]